MSEHKYNEAYSKGYRDGQKDQCLADAVDDALAMLDKLEVTNGDMIKAMFPNMETEYLDEHLIYPNGLYKSILREKPYNDNENNLVFVTKSLADWWNAPYKEVEE